MSLSLKICLIPACIELMLQPAVNVRNLVGQARHIIYHRAMGRSVKIGRVVASFPVNGDAKRPDAGACRLQQRTPRVFDAVAAALSREPKGRGAVCSFIEQILSKANNQLIKVCSVPKAVGRTG